MILHEITFGPVSKAARTDAVDAIDSYFSVLLHNGQAVGDYIITRRGGVLYAQIHLAGVHALKPKYSNTSEYASLCLSKVMSIFGREPQWDIADDDAPKRDTTWNKAAFLYLHTDLFQWASPLSRDNGSPIPIYRLPGTHVERERIYFWQKKYQNCLGLWFDSGDLETPTYKQLVDPTSELAETGRDICKSIETKTNVPTYYYLMRYHGRRTGENIRPCPGCGSNWSNRTTDPNSRDFLPFQFKCDPCRLLSHLGTSTDDERYAVTGEWNPDKQTPSTPS